MKVKKREQIYSIETRKSKKRKTLLLNYVLEKIFLNANKEIRNLRCLNSLQLGNYLFSKGFQVEGITLFKNNIYGKYFILLMTSKEGLNILSQNFLFKEERIEKLKILYKHIYQFRTKFCDNVKDEFPFY